MVFEPLADYIQLVVLLLDYALVEAFDEVEVFSPCRQNVLLAELSADIVGIIVAHQSEIGIYSGSELFKESDALTVSGGFFIEGHHGRDKVASGAV